MSFRPLPLPHGISSTSTSDSNASTLTNSTTASNATTKAINGGAEDMVRKMWLETTWTNLSIQAINLDLPSDTFFDNTTMLLSREINAKLWKQLLRLYKSLGPEQAMLATPIMEGRGEVKWHSFAGKSRGQEVDVFCEDKLRKQLY